MLLPEHQEAVRSLSHDIAAIVAADHSPASLDRGLRAIDGYVTALGAVEPERVARWSIFLRDLNALVSASRDVGDPSARESIRRLASILAENGDLCACVEQRARRLDQETWNRDA
jgi:hypothetical protein